MLVVVLAMLGLLRVENAADDSPSLLLFDAFQRLKPRVYDPETPVRILAVDGESLQRYGQWPWPRPYFVAMIERLQALGAAAIGFDVVLADADRTSPEAVNQTLQLLGTSDVPVQRRLAPTLHDEALGNAIMGAPVALGALPISNGPAAVFDGPFGLAVVGSDPRPSLTRIEALETPLPVLVASAKGYGLAGVGDGRSAIVRRQPLISNVNGEPAPAMALEALRLAVGAGNYVLRSSDAGAETTGGAEPVLTEVRLGPLQIPVSPDGTLWIRYAGSQPARTVPAWRLLDGAQPDPSLRREIEGRIVLIAATAPGLRYLAATPMGTGVDAVEVQAEMLEQILTGVTLSRPDWAPGLEGLAIVVAGVLALALINGRSAAFGAAVVIVLSAGLLGASWYAFAERSLLISPLAPMGTMLLSYMVLTGINYLRTAEQGRVVRGQFERFVAPQVIQSLIDDPERRAGLRGEEREVTLMFVDARGFTTLSETMEPKILISYLNSILHRVSDCILATGGTVDKFMGDGIMAFWNAPIDEPQHARRALETIAAIMQAQTALNADFERRGLPAVRLGVGVNTGPCNVGLIGSEKRLDYSCIGDPVNYASRLEGMTKTYGAFNCIGETTARQARGWPVAAVDRVAARGRQAVETVYLALDGNDPDGAARIIATIDAARDNPGDAPALAALEALETPFLNGVRLASYYRARQSEAA